MRSFEWFVTFSLLIESTHYDHDTLVLLAPPRRVVRRPPAQVLVPLLLPPQVAQARVHPRQNLRLFNPMAPLLNGVPTLLVRFWPLSNSSMSTIRLLQRGSLWAVSSYCSRCSISTHRATDNQRTLRALVTLATASYPCSARSTLETRS